MSEGHEGSVHSHGGLGGGAPTNTPRVLNSLPVACRVPVVSQYVPLRGVCWCCTHAQGSITIAVTIMSGAVVLITT